MAAPSTSRDTTYKFYTIGAVDPQFKNIWGFKTKTERNNFLALHLSKTVTGNAYWKQGDKIRANCGNASSFSFEGSYAYDYVEIINRPGSAYEKHYFCFITDRAYINLQVTELKVDIDWIQTFYFGTADLPIWSCSGYGVSTTNLNFLPKRGMGAEYPVPARQCYYKLQTADEEQYTIIIYSAINITASCSGSPYTLTYTHDFTNNDIVPVSSYIDQVMMGSVPYVLYGSAAQIAFMILQLNEDLNNSGQLGSITGMYVVPLMYINTALLSPGIRMITQDELLVSTITLPNATDIAAIPTLKNIDVLGGFDYTQIVLSNIQGEEVIYHYEDFTGQPTFKTELSIAAGYPVLIIYPGNNYKYGINTKEVYAMKQTNPPSCSWNSDNYAIWQAQNQNSRQAAINAAQLSVSNAKEAQQKTGGIASMLDDFFDSVSGDLTSGLSSLLGGALPENIQNAVTTAGYSGMNALLKTAGLGALGLEASYVYNQQVSVAEQALKSVEAQFADMKYLPSTASGSNAYGDLMRIGQYGFMIMITGPTSEYYQDLDAIMESSGHMCKGLITCSQNRKKFDYYRMLEAKLVNVPTLRPNFVTNMMTTLFNDGVYIWWVQAGGDIDTDNFGHPYKITNEVLTP